MSRSGLLRAIKDRIGDRLAVINFHRILPTSSAKSAFADDSDIDPGIFEAQIVWLKHNLRLLSEDELIAIADGRPAPKGLSGMITFDDGYIDNYTLAYPILRYHDVPAIFFVPTTLINRRELGWWDQIAYALKTTQVGEFTLDGECYDTQDPFTYVLLCRKMKKEMHLEGKDLVGDLRRILDVDAADTTLQSRELMTWDQIQALHPHVAIGSHTETHPILANQPLDRQRDELVRSKEILEAELGRPVRTLAYPVGGRKHFSPDTQRLAKEAGYKLAFSFYSGINRWSEFTPFDVRRSSVSGTDAPSLESATFLPEILAYEMGGYAA